MKIGFFDSGLGGLLTLKAVVKQLPQYDYEYYGDTAHLPYGDRSEVEIYELTKAGVTELFKRDCILVIIACNTASAETTRRLQDEWLPVHYPDRRLLGVIIPTVEVVCESGLKQVLLVATSRTVESGKYERELKKLDPTIVLNAIATPGLVPKLERGEHQAAMEELLPILKSHQAAGGNGVILGCTHYGLMADELRGRVDSSYHVLSQLDIIPNKLAEYLIRHPELEKRLTKTGRRNIHLTAHRADYDQFIASILGGQLLVGEDQ